jgi:Lecithin:cholesterol acyltransferase
MSKNLLPDVVGLLTGNRLYTRDGLTEFPMRHLKLNMTTISWRLPPMVTEERDGYLTNTIKRVETMYHDNGGLPVVLLCHSMGWYVPYTRNAMQ